MNYLVAEILLRFAKVAAASVVGLAVWLVLTGPLGVSGSPELALLAWLVGAASILLAESSPI